jgi:lipoyl(octanoyl) transferase
MTLSNRGILQVVHLGRTPFRECWDLQRRLLEGRMADRIADTLLLTEHPPVYTIGRTGKREHMLLTAQELRDQHVDFLPVERGGSVTFHGPGQLVAYPILHLLRTHPDLHWYVRSLESVVLGVLAHFDITGERHPRYTGVWVGNKKVCAIGIHTRGWVTMHGFALNVATDLTAFDRIVPCGIREKSVTSMSALLNTQVSVVDVEPVCIEEFCRVFSYDPMFLSPGGLAVDIVDRDRTDPSSSKEHVSCIK